MKLNEYVEEITEDEIKRMLLTKMKSKKEWIDLMEDKISKIEEKIENEENDITRNFLVGMLSGLKLSLDMNYNPSIYKNK